MGPIRVLNVITRLEQGGAPLALLETLRRMSTGRFRVFLAAGRPDDPALDLAGRVRDLAVIPVPAMRRNLHPLRDLRALWQLVRIIRAGRYHLVHTHTSKAGLLGRVAARLCGVRAVVHSPHGTILEGYFSRPVTRFFALLERLAAPLADRIVCLTPSEIDQYLAARIGRRNHYVCIRNGIDVEAFSAPRGRPDEFRKAMRLSPTDTVAISVGRLVPVKGHADLLHALARVPTLRLLLAGDGPLRADLEKLAERLGLAGRVDFLGWRDDVAELLEAADLFVLSSHNEGLGLVLVEAMAKRLPVVATAVGGVPDVVDPGRTGLLVAPHAPEDMARALAGLAADPALRGRMGEAGYRRAISRFTIHATVHCTEELYLELVEGPR